MFKVIVERPRGYKGEGAQARRRRNDPDAPAFLGMRAGYGSRGLNENLRPLERYLQAQVGRPWNKVFGEISANIDRRNTVQQHVLAHLDDMIAVQVAWRDGHWVDLKIRYGWFGREPEGLRQKLYVDPRTGLIRPNKSYRDRFASFRERCKSEAGKIAQRRRRIDDRTLLLLLTGEWYEVRTAPMPPGDKVFDAVLKKQVSRVAGDSYDVPYRLYSARYSYAVSKRQLSRREIADYGLQRFPE